MKGPIVTALATVVALALAHAPARAQYEGIDFEGAAPGMRVIELSGDAGTGPIGVRGFNPDLGDVNAAIIYDSSCLGG